MCKLYIYSSCTQKALIKRIECVIIFNAIPMFSKNGSTMWIQFWPRRSLPCIRMTSTKNPPSGLGPDLATCHFQTRVFGWFIKINKAQESVRSSWGFCRLFLRSHCHKEEGTNPGQRVAKEPSKYNDLKDMIWNMKPKTFQPCKSTHAASGCRDHHPIIIPVPNMFFGSWIINLGVFFETRRSFPPNMTIKQLV